MFRILLALILFCLVAAFVACGGGSSVTVSGGGASTIPIISLNFYLYAVNQTSNTISGFQENKSTGAITALTGSPFGTGATPSRVAADPKGRFLFVLSSGSIYSYTITPSTGTLTSVAGSPFSQTNCGCDKALLVDWGGNYLYALNSAGFIGVFSIDPTLGVLTGQGVVAATSPFKAVIPPSGQYIYVTNNSINKISGFNLNSATGAIGAAVIGSPFAIGASPEALNTDPTGTYLYAAPNSAGGGIYGYLISSINGSLSTLNGGVPWATLANPSNIVIDPTGSYLYLTASGSGKINGYTVSSATGLLTAMGSSPFATGTSPTGVIVDPTGQFLYATNSGATTISGYSLNSVSGTLSALSSSPFTAGTAPESLVISKVLVTQ